MRSGGNAICDTCNVRIPKYHPKLFCTLCNLPKHYKCQKLSKSDAAYIVSNTSQWICSGCISNILPVGACSRAKNNKDRGAGTFKASCHSCGGLSYSPKNVSVCPWCDNTCHVKCINNNLGCNKCCEKMIPGFHVHTHQLFNSDLNQRNSSLFNPYSQDRMHNQIGEIISNEEERNNMWNDISQFLIKCKYMQPKSIINGSSNQLNVLSLNVRSLNKNITTITDNIADFKKYDVLCFNETSCNTDRLPNGIDDLVIEGFHPPITQAPSRTSCRGGGLAIYVSVDVCSLDDIETIDIGSEQPSPNGEFLFVKIKQCKKVKKTVIVGSVYRSPSANPNNFIELIERVLQRLTRHNKKHVLIMGDFNIDLLKHEHDINGQNLIDTTTNHGFIQVISRPTRVTDHSATLIDHIYTNKISSVVSTSVVTFDISDHLATMATISLDTSLHNACSVTNLRKNGDELKFRLFNASGDEKFAQLIADEQWIIDDSLDAQAQYDQFDEIYTRHYNSAYPLITKRIRRKNERLLPRPWILPWLEDACARKNALYKTYVKNPTIENKIKYTKMKKFVDKHIKLAKSKYHKKYFEQYKDNSKKQWQMINSLLNRNQKKCGVSKLQDSTGTVTNTPQAIAEKFNEYFGNIATNLKAQNNARAQYPQGEFRNFLREPVQNSIFLKPVDSGEIHEIVKKLKNKSTLDTKINALKIANNDIKFTNALAKVITSSFEQGIFPQALKTARVVPIFKSGSKTDVSNYRPISLLASFSKIYEKLMHKRIVDFMEMNGSLHEYQYGFRAGRSCEHALLNAQSHILDSLSKNQISLLLLIDFSKAFDMVEHSVLLDKLSNYGIRGIAHKWFKSYLENREQFVSVNGKDSTKAPIKFGVPQGSILGPLLFVIYINDIPEIFKIAKFILYADDANIILTGESMSEISEKLSRLSRALVKWVDCNGLALNLGKTNYMIFSRHSVNDISDVYIAGTLINRKSEARFLGVIVDDKLSWTSHIKALKSKMCRYVGIMYKIKHLLPLQARLQIYHSFVQSHLNFCSLVWGFSCKSKIESLFSCQKKGLRAVMPGYVNYFYKDGQLPVHTKPAFKEYNILTVHGIIVKNTLIYMRKIYNFPACLPESVRDIIASDAPTLGSDHETSSSWLSKFANSCYRNSIQYKGPLLYSDPLCQNLISPTIKAYKNCVKRLLCEIQSKGVTEEWEGENFWLYNVRGLRKSLRHN